MYEAAAQVSSKELPELWSSADSLIMEDISPQNLTKEQAEEAVTDLLVQARSYHHNPEPEKRLFSYMRALSLDGKLEEDCLTRYLLHSELSAAANDYNSPNLAIRHAKIALNIYSKLLGKEGGPTAANKDMYDRHYQYLGYIAGVYIRADKPDSGLIYYRKANEMARLIKDAGAVAASANNIGTWHEMRGNLDSASWYYNEAIRLQGAQDKYDIELRYSIQDNQGGIYLRTGRYDKALELFRNNLHIPLKYPDRRAQALAAISETLLEMDNLSEADKSLTLMEATLDSLPIFDARWKQKFYKLKTNYYIRMRNPAMALKFRQMEKDLKDSLEIANKKIQEKLYESLISLRIGKVENELELQRLKSEELKQEARYKQLLIISVGAISVIVIISLIIYLRRRAVNHRQEQELLNARNRLVEVELRNKELEGEKLKSELESKSADLSNVSLYLAHLCNQNDEMFEELSQTRKLPASEQQASLKQIAQHLQVKMQTDNKTGLMLKNVDKVNQEFYTKLSARFPELSKAEIELCGYIKLNMSSTEIAALKNIAPKSVKMSRYRLRKKLGLAPDADIYAFIKSI